MSDGVYSSVHHAHPFEFLFREKWDLEDLPNDGV